jgi:hypothetical protein
MKILDEIPLAGLSARAGDAHVAIAALKLAGWRCRLSSTRDFGGLQVCRDHSTHLDGHHERYSHGRFCQVDKENLKKVSGC